MDLNCPHFSSCSGCSRDHHLEFPSSLNEAESFFSSLGISPLKFFASSPCEWRCRAKLAIRGTPKEPRIGLFEAGTHHVVDIPNCRVHHPAINRSVHILREWIITNNIQIYNEENGKGLLRYVQFAVDRSTGRIQMSLVLNTKKIESKYLELLWEDHHDLWHSLWVNFNTKRDNVIFGPTWQKFAGETWLWEHFCEREVCFHPASFAQANLDMFESLLKEIKSFIPQNASLIEFYSGVGAIGLTLVDKCHSLCCIEIVSSAKECFEQSLQRLPNELKSRLSFISGAAGAYSNLLTKNVNVVIVDPPRKGLDLKLLNALCQTPLQRLIYISCGWSSFQRDCKQLLLNGWKLHAAEAFLFFPGSDHLETLAIFDR